jgi:transcriptional regulator with XRE-family HTH domain
MAPGRTNQRFADEVRRLLTERGMSASELAQQAGVSQPYLSRLLRTADYKKTPSPRLARAIAEALGQPPDYFGEYREAALIEKIKQSPRMRDRLYDELVAAKKR